MPKDDRSPVGSQAPIYPTGCSDRRRRVYSEETPLLRAVGDVPVYHSSPSPDGTIRDNELAREDEDEATEYEASEYEASEYENMLERTISYSSQLGIGP